VTAFSNSRTQKIYIDGQAEAKGLKNLTVITGNVVDYEFEAESFDRIVSIEVRRPRPPDTAYCEKPRVGDADGLRSFSSI